MKSLLLELTFCALVFAGTLGALSWWHQNGAPQLHIALVETGRCP